MYLSPALNTVSDLSGEHEAAQELAGRGKQHAQLAKEARRGANQAAFDSCNMSLTNTFKVNRNADPVHAGVLYML